MNLYFRLLKTLLAYWLRADKRRGVFEDSVVRFRVWPSDLDTNFHMNNGRYLTLMDLGRLDLLLGLGIMPVVFRKKWSPVLASLQVRFRLPLNLFRKFEIRTRIVTWDTKWIYLEQRIFRHGHLALHAYLKAVFVAKHGTIPMAEVLAQTGLTATPLPMPEPLAVWVASEAKMIESERARGERARSERA